MLTQIRHIQKGLLIAVTIIIIIAFAAFGDFNPVSPGKDKQRCTVQVYGRCYRLSEVQRLGASSNVLRGLGLYEFQRTLFGEARQDQDHTNYVLRLLVLRHEAEKAGVVPTEEEIKEAMPNLPIFQQPWVNSEFLKNNILGPNGYTEADLAQLVKDYLSFEKLKELVGAGLIATEEETALRYIGQNQRYTTELIPFLRSDYVKDITITDEQIKEYYDGHSGGSAGGQSQENLMSELKRGFDYVKFSQATPTEGLSNEVKAQFFSTYADAVNRAYADLAEDDVDFLEVAKKHEGAKAEFIAEVGELEPFSQFDINPQIAPLRQGAAPLFSKVLQQGEVTIPFEGENGDFYVFRFKEQVDPVPLTLEEATEAIRTVLTLRESNQAANDAASAARATLTEALDAGKTFAEAVKEAGVTAEALPNFSLSEPPVGQPNARQLVLAAQETGVGKVSSVLQSPGDQGYSLLYVDKIELYEDADREASEQTIADGTLDLLKGRLFVAWFNQRTKESDSKK